MKIKLASKLWHSRGIFFKNILSMCNKKILTSHVHGYKTTGEFGYTPIEVLKVTVRVKTFDYHDSLMALAETTKTKRCRSGKSSLVWWTVFKNNQYYLLWLNVVLCIVYVCPCVNGHGLPNYFFLYFIAVWKSFGNQQPILKNIRKCDIHFVKCARCLLISKLSSY